MICTGTEVGGGLSLIFIRFRLLGLSYFARGFFYLTKSAAPLDPWATFDVEFAFMHDLVSHLGFFLKRNLMFHEMLQRGVVSV